MIYRVNILPRDKGDAGVVLDAHTYDPDTFEMGEKGEVITLSIVHPLAPPVEFMDIMHTMLERIGCPNPTQAEIKDCR